MIIGFQYKGFEPDERITAEIVDMLDHVQDIAPLGSSLVGVMDYDGKTYTCSLEIFTRNGSFMASANHENAVRAILHTEESVLEKMRKIRETRFYTRKPEFLTNRKHHRLEPVGT